MHSDYEIFEHDKLPWPLVAIDFEASELGFRSFPIEVGLARWQSFDAEIEVWGALIKPTDGWIAGGIWSAEAEAVHSIRKADLADGLAPSEIMYQLDRLVTTDVCWCDGAAQDDFWLGTLAHAAGVAPRFRLGDWDALGGALQPVAYERMVRWLGRELINRVEVSRLV